MISPLQNQGSSAYKSSLDYQRTCKRGWDFNKVVQWRSEWKIENASSCSEVCSWFDNLSVEGNRMDFYLQLLQKAIHVKDYNERRGMSLQLCHWSNVKVFCHGFFFEFLPQFCPAVNHGSLIIIIFNSAKLFVLFWCLVLIFY